MSWDTGLWIKTEDKMCIEWLSAKAGENSWSAGKATCSDKPSLILAGTTEKIFEEKRDLYDVYVDNQNVKTHHEHLQPLLKINNADKEKYRRLNDQR